MSQGLSVQAQAALAQRLQAGGVNGMNGGMLQLCRAASTTSFLGRLLHAFRMLCVTHRYLRMLQDWMPYKSSSRTKASPQECCKLSANLVCSFALQCHHAPQLPSAMC